MVELLAKPCVEQLDEDVINIIDKYGVNVVKYTIMSHFEINPDHSEDIRQVEEWERDRNPLHIRKRREHVTVLTLAAIHSGAQALTVSRVVKEVILADGNIVYQEVIRELYQILRHWVISIDAEGAITVFDRPKTHL